MSLLDGTDDRRPSRTDDLQARWKKLSASISKLPDLKRRRAVDEVRVAIDELAREAEIGEALREVSGLLQQVLAALAAPRDAGAPAMSALTDEQKALISAPVRLEVQVVRDQVTERIRKFIVEEKAPGASAESILAESLPHPADATTIQKQLAAIQSEMRVAPKRYAKSGLPERYRQLLELGGVGDS